MAGADRTTALKSLPKNRSYRVGDTARYLVKNPFPGARALITVERYGVLQSWLQTLDGGTPIIEFEVQKDFLPGFFLSVVVISPRVESRHPTTRSIWESRPFAWAMSKCRSRTPTKRSRYRLKPRRETYKPRDRVQVQMKATPRHPADGEPIELAVAVLDEAVFDLLATGPGLFRPL